MTKKRNNMHTHLEELERLAERNDFPMATIVTMQMSITTIGGGDYIGDNDGGTAREQFVHTSDKANLGWCLGGRAVHLARKFLDTPQLLKSFKDGVINVIEEELYTIRKELEKIDSKNDEDET